MATCPATAANSSQPKLPWNVLPKFAIHSIFSGEPCITSTPNTFNGSRPLPYWRIMPITGTASMSRYRMPCPAAAALLSLCGRLARLATAHTMRNVITVSVRKPKDLCRPNRLPAHSASSYSGLTKTSTALPRLAVLFVLSAASSPCPDFC